MGTNLSSSRLQAVRSAWSKCDLADLGDSAAIRGIVSERCAADTTAMSIVRPSASGILLVALTVIATLASTDALPAQGLTGGVVHVTVQSRRGDPVNATVTLYDYRTGASVNTNAQTGERSFDNLVVGFYRIEARAIGMLPALLDSVELHIGERVRVRLMLDSIATHGLDAVIVSASTLRNAGAGGPATFISRALLQGLPLLDRNFAGLFGLSSHASGPGSLWVSGQHSRFNSIQIDGVTTNDPFGVNVSAGSGAGGRSIAIESLDEIRVLVAPFDVRHGGFSGGLINAVSRSGSNLFRGAGFTSYSTAALVGPDTARAGVPAFDQLQYGMSVGGPIVKNRLHYFGVAEAQTRTTTFEGPSVEEPTTGVSAATAARAAEIFRDRYGFDAGEARPPDLAQPNLNLFLKLSWLASSRHTVELVQSLASARVDALNRVSRNLNNVDGWQLSNSGSVARSRTLNARLKINSTIRGFSNEAIVSMSKIAIASDSRNKVPLFTVGADLPNIYIAGGSTKSAQGTRTTQRMLELTDNLSWSIWSHRLTVGTQNMLVHVDDNFFLGSWGVWSFANVDALDRGQPSLYEVALPGPSGGPIADYGAAMLAAYAQDEWRLHERATVTAGIRVDAPVFDAPRTNPSLKSNERLGNIDTGDFPSGNAVLSPRIGFAVELGRERRSTVRGGVGVFAGRPPLAWLTGAYSGTGQEQTTLVCRVNDGVPAPTTDIANLPSRCLRSTASLSVPSVNVFDPAFRFQRAVKYAIGIDRDLGSSATLSVDVVHTRSRDNIYVEDVNLMERGVNSEGRMMYGSVRNDGIVKPFRVDSTAFGPIYRYDNVSGDRSTSVAASLEKKWGTGGFAKFGYDWSRTLDIMSMTGFISSVIFRTNPVDGTLARRTLRTSARDMPHNLVATVISPRAYGVNIGATLRARSGTPYAFTASGDPNADGTTRNDLMYVPRDAADISLSNPATYQALDKFIKSQDCLGRQRGRIMQRNSCRNPAVVTLDGRLSKLRPDKSGKVLEVYADLFNIPNMLYRRWGFVRETTNREDIQLLPVGGWDSINDRPLYSVPVLKGEPVFPPIGRVVPDASRWRIQIGARYDF